MVLWALCNFESSAHPGSAQQLYRVGQTEGHERFDRRITYKLCLVRLSQVEDMQQVCSRYAEL